MGAGTEAVRSIPPVRYARVGAFSLAFQVFGSGDRDIVVIPPMAHNIELMWERAEFRRIFDRMGRYARVVHFDKRGTGVSDRTAPVPTMDERVDDTRAVMDAAGLDRCFLYGLSEGGPMAVLFAVTYPERVLGLVLHASQRRGSCPPTRAPRSATLAGRCGRSGSRVGHRGDHDVVAVRADRRPRTRRTGPGNRASSDTRRRRRR